MGVYKKIRILGGFTKNEYIREELPKKRRLGQFKDLQGGLTKEGRGVFEGGGFDTPMHTMSINRL